MKTIALAVLIVSAAFFAVRIVPYLRRPTGGFLGEYYAGRMLAAHEEMSLLYDHTYFEEVTRSGSGLPFGENYTANTPVLPLLLAPFALLPMGDAKLAWVLFSLICTAIALALLYGHLRLNSLERIVATALAFGFAPLYANFVWGQVYAFLFLLHFLALKFWTS